MVNPGSPVPSRSSSDTIELAEFEDVLVTPDPDHIHRYKQSSVIPEPDPSESDDEDNGLDEGDLALLGAGRRADPRAPARRGTAWTQVRSLVIETSPTLLVTTIGLLFTGELLSTVSHWKELSRVDELIMIIPVVLNLKGNLEMNLSARLSTAANIGELDKADTRRQIIIGNLTLLQVQAAVVSFVAACVVFVLGRITASPAPAGSIPTTGNGTIANATASIVQRALLASLPASSLQPRKPRPSLPQGGKKISGPHEFIMVASAAMCSCALSGVFLGSFMCGLIVLCRRWGYDPDNVSPPVAGCLGDMLTLSILSVVSLIHVRIENTPLPLIFVICLSAIAIGLAFSVRRNPQVSHLLKQGWWPLFAAMIISNGTGLLLDTFVTRYQGYALIAVVITGLPGSVGAIFVSRLSTALHAAAITILPSSADHKVHPSPHLVMTTLLVVGFPIQLVFLVFIYAFGWIHLPFIFVVLEILFYCTAVAIALVLARGITEYFWKWELDPDMYALPIHSALMDVVGQSLLVACFEVASLLGAKVRSIKS
ncbi:uncharacterized protein C8Q71DRAFT_733161 [Rhodofomes roseus]|uniref:SLC41A/MgtE integral membrane domain-containing protein n=1 Tax=Rhodofomes roseus TaxID=34475 RepID=A0ABQ8KTV4_9APHY|nr:uncharacterized protein C8Q71DRAFT_733161 [Rhodofomes roseus]KAH9842512.1 hypothetical protein C8Q71DRAFT_733161 [Rhodofomes roseus]